MFESSRLRFRAPIPSDLMLLHQWWSDPEIMQFQTTGFIRISRESTNVELFDRWFSDTGNDVGFIITHRESGEVMGFCNLWGANLKNRSAMLGILLGKPYWGHGFGSEALALLLDYAFTELNFHRVELGVFAFNQRAIHVYQKVGFREAGRRRQTLFRAGQWHDEVIMDLLQDEYLATRGSA